MAGAGVGVEEWNARALEERAPAASREGGKGETSCSAQLYSLSRSLARALTLFLSLARSLARALSPSLPLFLTLSLAPPPPLCD